MVKYGWLKDKWNDKAVYHLPKVVLQPWVDYTQYLPAVRDQMEVGACTGFGIGAEHYAAAFMNGSQPSEWYSPVWLYNGARSMEGTLGIDAGAMPDDVYDWVQANGLLYERFWPFTGLLDPNAPSAEQKAQAFRYASYSHIRVDNGESGIISALSDGHCVAVGMPWPKEWVEGSKDILAKPGPGTLIVGGHEVLLYGYDEARGFFRMQNSWGTGWSDGGRARIPLGCFEWAKGNGGYDAHYSVFTVPAPVPDPQPADCCPVVKLLRRMRAQKKAAANC